MKDFNREDAALCKAFCLEKGILSVGHSPYPTSLTPQSKVKETQVIESLLNDLDITDACGAIGVVVHFGKPSAGLDILESYRLMIHVLDETLERWDGEAKILLENSGALPGAMGTTLEELVQIRSLCRHPEKVGFCLDTCHAFASGLWDGDNWTEVMEKGIALGYFDQLLAVHLNNSKYPALQGKDRHAPIFGNGYIAVEQFDQLITTPELAQLPFILETPKEEMPHEEELRLLFEKWRG